MWSELVTLLQVMTKSMNNKGTLRTFFGVLPTESEGRYALIEYRIYYSPPTKGISQAAG